MLSTLHQFIDLKKEAEMPYYSLGSKRYEVVARLYFLLNKLSEEQKITLLKLLLRNKMVDYTFKLVIDLSDTQRLILMKQLEQITSKRSHYDRRKFIRKNCLINAKISVATVAVQARSSIQFGFSRFRDIVAFHRSWASTHRS